MVIKDGNKEIFEILGDKDGNCEIVVLDGFYFTVFYEQSNRISNLDKNLKNVKFSEKERIERYIKVDNEDEWDWKIEE